MARMQLGMTLAIANPTSHSGKSVAGAESVRRFFETYTAATTGFELRFTAAAGDAERIAAEAEGYDTILVIGGDGVIHEAVNGLMTIEEARRPRLAIVPFGSGNDYARTLGLAANDPEKALSQLLTGSELSLDLGLVSSDAYPQSVYFTESLSFGLDAAIALDTTMRRAEGTRQQGEGLFLTSSLKLALRASKGYPCVAQIDGDKPMYLTSLIFAVLNGPTYGGGFRICPQANPRDGVLDVCYNVRHPWMPHLMFLLGLARFGLHARSRLVRLRTFSKAQIEFPEGAPCQVDGEELAGTRFSIEVVPKALRVVASRNHCW
ncbi:MAG: diacylglycerol kinase family lipid kinase [Atopobiaceae bacterium]|nr:diacylglycerol kinase family lipid kinase [Atopobiaceae bacterium]